MKTNIKLQVTPEQSEAIQNICFTNNIGWIHSGQTLTENVRYIFIGIDAMTLTYNSTFFHNHEFEEVDADLFIRTNGTCVEPEETTIEATIEECQFEKYGFEKPDFECEIWKVEISVSFEFIHGLVLNGYAHPMGNLQYHKWNKKTGEVLVGYTSKELKPIKKPWYETCKFPCLVKYEDDIFPIYEKEGYSEEYLTTLTPLTNDEIEELKQ